RSTGPVDQIEIVPVRERFVDGPAADAIEGGPGEGDPHDGDVTLFEFLGAHGVHLLASEHEQVVETARKVREQLSASYEAAVGGRTGPAEAGHYGVAPPSQLFADWDDLEPRLDSAPRLEELAIESV